MADMSDPEKMRDPEKMMNISEKEMDISDPEKEMDISDPEKMDLSDAEKRRDLSDPEKMTPELFRVTSTPVQPEENRPNAASRKESTMSPMRRYFAVEVSTKHVDLLLLVCCLVTGFVDSTLYNGMPL